MVISNYIRRLAPTVKLIIANIAVYAAVCLVSLINGDGILASFLILPDSWMEFALQPWTAVTYSFLHANLWHLIANMLWLYCFGSIFLQFYSVKRFFIVYAIGAVVGAMCYLTASLFAPSAGLTGASAAVMAIAAAAVTASPDYNVSLWLFGNVRIKWIAVFYVAFALLTTQLTIYAVCPHAAHLGGILVGVVSVVLKKSSSPRRRRTIVTQPLYSREQIDEMRLDALLDKVRASGYASLSEKDKNELIELSKRFKR